MWVKVELIELPTKYAIETSANNFQMESTQKGRSSCKTLFGGIKSFTALLGTPYIKINKAKVHEKKIKEKEKPKMGSYKVVCT